MSWLVKMRSRPRGGNICRGSIRRVTRSMVLSKAGCVLQCDGADPRRVSRSDLPACATGDSRSARGQSSLFSPTQTEKRCSTDRDAQLRSFVDDCDGWGTGFDRYARRVVCHRYSCSNPWLVNFNVRQFSDTVRTTLSAPSHPMPGVGAA